MMSDSGLSHAIEMVRQSLQMTAWDFSDVAKEMKRPSTIHKPELSMDGNMYCALVGKDLQSGCAGFGSSPASAFEDFDANWIKEHSLKETHD